MAWRRPTSSSRVDPHVIAARSLFRRLVAGLSVSQFAHLLCCGYKPDKLYRWHPSSSTVAATTTAETPWPIEFILTAFHPKHIFHCGIRPKVASVSKAFHLWRHRRLWAIHMCNRPPSVWRHLSTRTSQINPCPHVPAQEIMIYFNEIERAVHALAVQATEHERLVPKLRQTPGIINMCFDMLKDSKFVPIKSDKDGGFAFCTEAEFLPAVRKMFFQQVLHRESDG